MTVPDDDDYAVAFGAEFVLDVKAAICCCASLLDLSLFLSSEHRA